MAARPLRGPGLLFSRFVPNLGSVCDECPTRRQVAFDRVCLDAPWIEVDTTSGYHPGIDQVTAWINAS
jgi:hypothetical protein